MASGFFKKLTSGTSTNPYVLAADESGDGYVNCPQVIMTAQEAINIEPYMTDFILVGKCVSTSLITGACTGGSGGSPPYSDAAECDTAGGTWVPSICTVSFDLEHSPDGVNWVGVVDSQGESIKFQCTSNLACLAKIIDVPLLGHVRGLCGEADIDGCVCKLQLFYTNEK